MGEIHQFPTDVEIEIGRPDSVSVGFHLRSQLAEDGTPELSVASGLIRIAHTELISVAVFSDKPVSDFCILKWDEEGLSRGEIIFYAATMPGIFIQHLNFYSIPKRHRIVCCVNVDEPRSPTHELLNWFGQLPVAFGALGR